MNAQMTAAWAFGASMLLFTACERETVPPFEPPVQPDERDLFVGAYKVYDTVGVYLYEMNISKFGTGGRDSLYIENYADTFDLKILHERYWMNRYLRVSFFPAIDKGGFSWALFGASIEDGSNVIRNDTIPLKFTLSNIAFYWEEGVPYYSCVCKQIAVKQ